MNRRCIWLGLGIALILALSLSTVCARPGYTGLLQNWSFEGDFRAYEQNGHSNKTAYPWLPFVEAGDLRLLSTSEYAAGGFAERIEGYDSQFMYTPTGQPYIGGVYQQVSGLTISAPYAVSGFILSIYKSIVVRPPQDGYMLKKIGIDPYGGVDPTSPNIVWSPESGLDKSWGSSYQVTVYALSSTITVFARVNSTDTVGPGTGYYNESIIDAIYLDNAPTASLNPLPAWQGSASFAVSWSGAAPEDSALYNFDVQYKDGAAGIWTDWLTNTTATNATFSGVTGHTYYFQARARAKRQGHPFNETYGLYPGGNGQARTTLCAGNQQFTLTVGTPSPSADVPKGLAIDPNTNRLYVGNDVDNSIAIFDGNTHALLGAIAGVAKPNGVAVDPALNRVYVTNHDSATVTVIDAQTNGIIGSIPVGSLPYGVAVDPHTHRVYVANWGSGGSSISIINGLTLQVVKTIPVDNYAAQVAVNPATHRAYVTGHASGKLYVIDSNDNLIAQPGVAPGIVGVSVDVINNLIYVASRESQIYVVDGNTNAVSKTISSPSRPYAVAVHPLSNLLYVTAAGANTLYGIDTTSDLLAATLPIGGGAEDGLTINLSANRLYVANNFSGTVSVVQDGCATVPALPSSAVLPLPAIEIATTFPVTWAGAGGVGGIGSWDVQTRSLRLADQTGMGWSDWLSNTSLTTTIFTGQDGYAYSFRSRAWDNAGRAEAYPAEAGASTQVLMTPSPVLLNSSKSVHRAFAVPGDWLTYTITLSNTGNLSATVFLTDTLPVSLTQLLTNTLQASAGTPVYSDTVITWGGPLAAGSVITVSFALQISVTTPLGTYITNSVQLDDGVHPPFTRTATTWIAYQTHLPLVMKTSP